MSRISKYFSWSYGWFKITAKKSLRQILKTLLNPLLIAVAVLGPYPKNDTSPKESPFFKTDSWHFVYSLLLVFFYSNTIPISPFVIKYKYSSPSDPWDKIISSGENLYSYIEFTSSFMKL